MTSEKTAAPPPKAKAAAGGTEMPDTPDIDPATSPSDKDEDARLPELADAGGLSLPS